MPCAEAAPEAELAGVAVPVEEEEIAEPCVIACDVDCEAMESAVLLGAKEPVVIGKPSLSVVGAGSVVTSAAATVTLRMATPVLV